MPLHLGGAWSLCAHSPLEISLPSPACPGKGRGENEREREREKRKRLKGHSRVARGERKVGQLSKLSKLCEKVGKLCHMKWSTSSVPSGSVASGLCHQVRSVSRRAVRVPCRKCVCVCARALSCARVGVRVCARECIVLVKPRHTTWAARDEGAHVCGGRGQVLTRVGGVARVRHVASVGHGTSVGRSAESERGMEVI